MTGPQLLSLAGLNPYGDSQSLNAQNSNKLVVYSKKSILII